MKNRFKRPRVRRPASPAGASPAPDELPRTADEIDLDRLVWDPAYRCAVRPLIDAEPGDDVPAPGAAARRPRFRIRR